MHLEIFMFNLVRIVVSSLDSVILPHKFIMYGQLLFFKKVLTICSILLKCQLLMVRKNIESIMIFFTLLKLLKTIEIYSKLK